MADVEFESPDPVWDDRFARERDRVERVVDDGLLGVFHVGSTAIPDLPAKPTLDAVAVFEGREAVANARDALLADGFGRHRDDPDWVVVTREAGVEGTDREAYGVCLHLRPRDHETWCDQVVFGEYLREDVRARATYERAKHVAAETHPDDVTAYTEAKEPTILSLVDEAYDRGYGTRLPAFAPLG